MMFERWASWTNREYNLDKMTLRQLVIAFFTHYSIQVYLLLAAVGIVLAALWAETVWAPVRSALVMVLLYPLVEYVLHRWLLHATWLYKSPLTAKAWKRIHYDHHQNPHDLTVLFGALYTTLPTILLITLPLGWLLGGAAGSAAAMSAGMLIFSVYEFCHCVQHLPFTPSNPWLREIKKRHLAHHFHSEQGNFGITSGIWDRVFGTLYGQMRGVERSPTTFNLGYTGAEREQYPWVAELSATEEELAARRQRRRAAA
jgi:sterol desaturase/sphingolipid hydroxylase (fatty acid hydroxylase superfamily)